MLYRNVGDHISSDVLSRPRRKESSGTFSVLRARAVYAEAVDTVV